VPTPPRRPRGKATTGTFRKDWLTQRRGGAEIRWIVSVSQTLRDQLAKNLPEMTNLDELRNSGKMFPDQFPALVAAPPR